MFMHLQNTSAAQDKIYGALGDAQSLIEDLDAQLSEARKQLEAVTEERDDFKQRAEEAEGLLENYAEIIKHYNALVQ